MPKTKKKKNDFSDLKRQLKHSYKKQELLGNLAFSETRNVC